jgi:3-methyladenine DNA glycosylase Tag
MIIKINMDKDWTPPKWWYTNGKPPSDTAYFENLTHCVFQAGLNWKVVDNKWPNFRNAFHRFNITSIMNYEYEDIKRLMEDQGIVRNKSKILATIENAKEFQTIASEYGGFKKWLESIDKSSNYNEVICELKGRFKHVGEMTSRIFLHSVGEPIEVDDSLYGHNC